MGSKNKLKRFKENETFENVFQPSREEVVSGSFPFKGVWNQSFFKNENSPNPYLLIDQIKKEIDLGIIKPLNPKQLVLDIFSMTVFPFAAQMMVKGILHLDDAEFNLMMEERKTTIAEQIINSIKK